MATVEELTRQFYEWELRGRGWEVFNCAVELEPPFEPFHFHAVPEVPFIDDGLRENILFKAAKLVKNAIARNKNSR